MGANIIPIAKNRGRTDFGVRIGLVNNSQRCNVAKKNRTRRRTPRPARNAGGLVAASGKQVTTYCQAFNLCCLKAVSIATWLATILRCCAPRRRDPEASTYSLDGGSSSSPAGSGSRRWCQWSRRGRRRAEARPSRRGVTTSRAGEAARKGSGLQRGGCCGERV